MTFPLNYRFPLLNDVALTVDPIDGFPRATLPAFYKPRMLLNIFTGSNGFLQTDYISGVVNGYGYNTFGREVYIGTVIPSQMVFSDTSVTYKGNGRHLITPILIPHDTQVICRYTNVKAAAVSRITNVFAVVRKD